MTKFLRPSALPAGFDADFYLKTYPDVALSGLSPDYHYLHYGSVLGRKISASAHPVLGMAMAAPAARAQSPAAPPTASPAPRGPSAQAASSSVSPAPGTSAPVSSASPAAAHAPQPQAKTAAPSAVPNAPALAAAWQGASPDALPPALLDALYAQGPIPISGPEQHGELVTIILPSYNNAPYLARAIHSALSQTGVRIELIVVDDGSTDASVAIASRIAEGVGAGRMKVISLLRNFGCYYARNIGVMEAKGDYITIIDSDDIMSPDRILRQMAKLKASPDALGCTCQLRRWSVDYAYQVGEQKFGEVTLLWRRELLDSIGWYDSVRYSADAEFRYRIQRRFGGKAIVRLEAELYFARTLETSLTTKPGSGVFQMGQRELTIVISQPRRAYSANFDAWHKQKMPKSTSGSSQLRIDFPLRVRPFALGADSQNAAPSLGQRCVGAMASYPPRREGLHAAINSILPQLDELILYLNDYSDVPEFVQHTKIRLVRSQDAKGDLRDNGKFYDLPKQDAYIFTLDDDLIYPPDYVARLIHQIDMLGRSSIVGVHGVNFPKGSFDKLSQRQVHSFDKAHCGSFVDLLGTGTAAWHASVFMPKLDDFKTAGACDLWFTAQAAQQNIPTFCVSRPAGWVNLYKRFEENLFSEALQAPKNYFDIYQNFVAPSLEKSRSRYHAEQALVRGFDSDTLRAAGVGVASVPSVSTALETAARATEIFPASQRYPATARRDALRFHIVVNGWNCVDLVDDCLRSIAQQRPGPFDYQVTLIDDGSEDGTDRKLASTTLLPGARLLRVLQNTGPAYARHIGISTIEDPEAIVVLLDMDDTLEPNALRRVAECYLENPACLMTIGNWQDQNGKLNPQGFYSPDEIDRQKLRQIELFNATHLRTFRRKLYDAITEDDLLGPDGRWLETCTDVALMYPLMDQCWSEEIEFIAEPIYRYNRQHSSGTLARFGKPHKVERLAFLKAKPPKPRLHPERPQRLAAQ